MGRLACLPILLAVAWLVPAQTGVRLLPGETRRETVHVEAGQTVTVSIRTLGRPVLASINKEEAFVRIECGLKEPERLLAVAEAGGDIEWVLRHVDSAGDPADVTLSVTTRATTPHDRDLLELQRLYRDAGAVVRNEPNRAAGLYRDCAARARQLGFGQRERVCLLAAARSLRQPEAYQTALAAARSAGDDRIAADALYGLGFQHSLRSEAKEALGYWEEAVRLLEPSRDRFSRAVVENNIGWALASSGETDRALEVFERVRALRHELADPVGEAYTQLALASTRFLRGEFQQALDAYDAALPLWRSLHNQEQEALTRNNRGLVYQRLGQPELAIAEYEAALKIWRARKNTNGQANTVLNQGIAYGLLPDAARAIRSYRLALELATGPADRKIRAYALHQLAEALGRQGRYEEAAGHFAESLAIKRDLHDPYGEAATIQALGAMELARGRHAAARAEFEQSLTLRRTIADRDGQAVTLAALAGVSYALAEYPRARREIDEALERVETSRTQLAREDLRGSSFASRRGMYEQSIAILLKLGEVREALQVSERMRARLLLDALAEYHIEAPAPAGIQTDLLDADTLLLEYALGTESSVVWAVTRDSVTWYPLPGRAVIERQCRALHQSLTALNAAPLPGLAEEAARRREVRQTQQQQAAALARMVLEPVKPHARRIAVVADGALEAIPFALLPVRGGALIDRAEVVQLPSMAVLATIRQREHSTGRGLVLADPAYTDDRYPRLTFAAREAEDIAALAGRANLDLEPGPRASRRLLLGRNLQRYGWLHFATHAVMDPRRPELSAIVLSQKDAAGNPVEGHLRLYDIYNLKLRARFVVLGSCRSAAGPSLPGEGLLSLSRGFLYAGARSVIAGNWAVDDRQSARFMRLLYQGLLRDRLTPSAALRRAQREIRQEPACAAASCWAAFTLQGDWR